MGGVWFVKMVWGVGGKCMVYIGWGVVNGVVMVCERENGWCGLWSLMRHDKLKNMGHFVSMKKEVY